MPFGLAVDAFLGKVVTKWSHAGIDRSQEI
jgi:hypothetical protein